MKPCPACRRETQDDLKECPHCGVVFTKWKAPRKDSATVKASSVNLSPATDGNLSTGNNNIKGWGLWFVVGLIMSWIGIFLFSEDSQFYSLFFGFLILGFLSGFLKPIGTWRWYLAGGAGLVIPPMIQEAMVGIGSLFNIIFLFLTISMMAFLSSYIPGVYVGEIGRWIYLKVGMPRESGELKVAQVSLIKSTKAVVGYAVIVGILAAISIPNYIKHIKRSRTDEGSTHTQMICKTVADWIPAQGKTDGSPSSAPDPDQVGQDGKTFREQHPSESDWMISGDEFYRYSVSIDGPFGSGPQNPVVVAESREGPDDGRVYGVMVQAGGKGRRSGQDLSGCKSSVEEISGNY